MATVLKSPLLVINSNIEFLAHSVYEARNEPLIHDKVRKASQCRYVAEYSQQ